MNISKQNLLLAFALCTFGLGGCSTLETGPSNQARLASGKYIHIPLVSMDEDKLLREATERALVLHSQLRAFDVANKSMESRILRMRGELQSNSKGGKRSIPKASSESELLLSNRIDVRFAKGSATIDDRTVTNLSKTLVSNNLTLRAKDNEPKQFVVLQVATHKKDGLDSLNARRLGAIHELFKKHNVPTETIKLKIVRIPNSAQAQTSEIAGEGNASRVIQFSALRSAKLEL